MASAAPIADHVTRENDLPVLSIENLHIQYGSGQHEVRAVRGVSLELNRGETLGIVGESGCGKSTLAFAVMRYLGTSGRITEGAIRLSGQDLLELSDAELREMRGRQMAMVYQDPQTALNPAIVVGEQVAETYRTHEGASRDAAWARALDLLRRVGLPDPERAAQRYPHQLSGGQQQRVVIALGLVCSPELLILDEPTTGLDVTTEATILDLVNDLKRDFNSAVLFITHNLGVIAQVCDRVAVMYAGEVVEEGPVHDLFRHPSHPYTIGLLGCVPRIGEASVDRLQAIPGVLPPPGVQLPGCQFAPRCPLARQRCVEETPGLRHVAPGRTSRCHFWEEADTLARVPAVGTERPSQAAATDGVAPAPDRPLLQVRELRYYYNYRPPSQRPLARLWRRLWPQRQRPVRAVEDVSFNISAGETVALVGESGCGKTTVGGMIAGLLAPTSGAISFMGQDISMPARRRDPALQRRLQVVFQNPDASLNPRHTVGQIITRPLRLLLGLRGDAARQQAEALLQAVNLDPSYCDRYPSQLSGGQKQRVAIARALAGDRRLVICDEPVSALDVSVQATVLNLLQDLQDTRGTAYLFVSHDLAVVRHLAHRIVVIYLGEVMETGWNDDLFHPPYHPYTEALLSAVPVPDPTVRRQRIRLQGPVPSAMDRPTGCPFHTRCPRKIGAVCETMPPPLQKASDGHLIRCHIPLDELAAFPPVMAATVERAPEPENLAPGSSPPSGPGNDPASAGH